MYIFDIDDTLYLERDYVKSGFTAVGRALDLPALGDYCWSLFLDGVRGTTFNLALEKFPQVKHSVLGLVECYRRHFPQIALCPDARALLEQTIEPCAVISDGPIASQRAKYQALGLVPWIDCPIFTQEIGAPKPSSTPYMLASWALCADPKDCIYVADNPIKDFNGAKACGMQTVRIRRRGSLHENVPNNEDIDREIEDFGALLRG